MEISNVNKINNIQVNQKVSTNNSNEIKSEYKQIETDADGLQLKGSYNIAFQGLFHRKPKSVVLPQLRAYDVQLEPNVPYTITPNMNIVLGEDININTNDYEFRNLVASIKPKKSVIIGREAELGPRMSHNVSRQHLELKKEKNGDITIKDLNSTNGTKIAKNVESLDSFEKERQMIPGVKYLCPPDCAVQMGEKYAFSILDCEQARKMKIGDKLTMGRGDTADIRVPDECSSVSRNHLLIEQSEQGYVVTDLHSSNGTKLVKFNGIDNSQGLLYTTEISDLTPNEPILIPEDCQLRLGKDLIIDLRNKNIKDILDAKGKITVGRNPNSDVRVEGFFGTVSNNHLMLEKFNGKVYATDLHSTNGTQVVPKNRAKAFFNGVQNTEFSQANVGDCYLLSTLYALSRNPAGARIIENMITIDDKGNYHVKFNNSDPITVCADELDGQEIPGKEKKCSVRGELGIKAIERAYGRHLLRGGNSGRTMYMKIDQGGFPDKTLTDITGIPCTRYFTKNEQDMYGLLTAIARENPNNHF